MQEFLTVKGGTGAIIEYFGDGAEAISATGKGTICNMGAEVGATTSLFAYDESMERYLNATGRKEISDLANTIKGHLKADPEVYENPEIYYDELIDINLSELEPHINGPFTPDRATPISKMGKTAKENGWPTDVSVGLIGSCTNSSYEDISRAASIAAQAVEKGLTAKSEFTITPGSEQVRYTIGARWFHRNLLKPWAPVFLQMPVAHVSVNGRDRVPEKRREKYDRGTLSTVTSQNAPMETLIRMLFVTSPEMVTALAIAGKLDFNPITDSLVNNKGEKVKLDPPTGFELPIKGFDVEDAGYQAPAKDGSNVQVNVADDSNRLQLLTPFKPWDGKNIEGAKLLIKALGKCTTDHISMAGPWLRFRGASR